MDKQPFWARVTLLYDEHRQPSLVPMLITTSLGAVLDEYSKAHDIERGSIRHISADDFLRQPDYSIYVKALETSIEHWEQTSWQWEFLRFLQLARRFELGGITTDSKDRRTLEVLKKDLLELATFANKFGDVSEFPHGHVAMLSERILKIAGKIRGLG